MTINTQAGQQIEFTQKIQDFGWILTIRSDGTAYNFDLTDEEVKWIHLDLDKRLYNRDGSKRLQTQI